ncbi:unnamed protein product, partial [Symbiodinium natans]
DTLWNAVLEYWPDMDKRISRIDYVGTRHQGSDRVRHVCGAIGANDRLYRAFAEGCVVTEAVRDLVDEKAGTVIHPGGQCLSGHLQFKTWTRILGRPEQPVSLECRRQVWRIDDVMACVVCAEDFSSNVMEATNIFTKMPCGSWRMVHHHGSPSH